MKTESRIMEDCHLFLHNHYPALRGLYFTIGNNSFSMQSGMNQKAMGRIAGVADACLCVPGGMAIFIEFKTEKGKQSDVQIKWEATITKAGFRYFIVRSLDDFKAILGIYI